MTLKGLTNMNPLNFSGKLILFEGPEGAGKSTVIEAVAAYLKNYGFDTVLTKEPGHDTYLGREIREILLNPKFDLNPKGELSLFLKSRADHFRNIIVPALKTGKIILCDRSSPSTIAYQHYGRGLDLSDILARDAQARSNIDFDLVILLDIDPAVGLARKGKNPDNRFESEALEFHRRIRAGYFEQAKKDSEKWVVIDASQPLERVIELTQETVSNFLSLQHRRT